MEDATIGAKKCRVYLHFSEEGIEKMLKGKRVSSGQNVNK
jgi:hypothetical protein